MSLVADASMMDALERQFAALATLIPAGGDQQVDSFNDAWARVAEVGIPLLLVPESAGGLGGSWLDLATVLHRAAYHALPLPIGESVLVSGLLAHAGLESSLGLTSFGICATGRLIQGGHSGRARFSGAVRAVPWGRFARHVLVELASSDSARQHVLVEVDHSTTLSCGTNIAAEPRDTLVMSAAPAVRVHLETNSLFSLGALLRAAQVGGAFECALDLCLRYVRERTQFGRRLGEFQAIQQQLAVLAEETAAVSCAATAAAAAAARGTATFEIAAAKLRANLAVGRGTAIAHQCHGAIGMTREYALQRSTRLLWSWRSEFGNDRYWGHWLGETAGTGAQRGLWSMLVDRDSRAGD